MKNLTCCEKTYICGLHDGGMSVGEIVKKMGERVSASGVYKVLQRENENGPPSTGNPVGRPEKHSARDKRAYIINEKRGKQTTPGQAIEHGATEMSKYAIRKLQQQANLNNNKVTKKKPKATKRHSNPK
jgi:transposase